MNILTKHPHYQESLTCLAVMHATRPEMILESIADGDHDGRRHLDQLRILCTFAETMVAQGRASATGSAQ